MKRFLRNYRLSIPTGAVLIAALGWLVFGYFGAHLLFVDDEVNEAVPTFATPSATVDSSTSTSTSTSTTTTSTTTAASPSAAVPVPVEPASPPTAPPATVAPAPVIVTEVSGAFESRGHATSGTASVLGDGSGQRFLRFENFSTSNGPDLNVYLVKANAGGIDDAVNLGDLKGNVGDQNYVVPVGTDLAVYDTVVVWCVRFNYSFGQATLRPS